MNDVIAPRFFYAQRYFPCGYFHPDWGRTYTRVTYVKMVFPVRLHWSAFGYGWSMSPIERKKEADRSKLVYIEGQPPGITRKKHGKSFVYFLRGKKILNSKTLSRIKSLVLPPAWTNVWICPNEKGHLQATGYDAAGRKQYRYHAHWSATRNETKFHRLNEFGNALTNIRARMNKDMSLPGLPLNKVLATVLALMDLTGIRIGNNEYEKLYGSYGLSTLKDKHVCLRGTQIKFQFKGKKGVHHAITVQNKRLAKIVKQCRDIPGKELFQYYDESGKRQTIDSGMVNNYLREIAGEEFTSKDFRTWSGTMHALVSLKSLAENNSSLSTREKVNTVLDEVAQRLGNTRAVCKKYYVHPLLLQMAENQDAICFPATKKSIHGLKKDEQVLLKLLQTAA